MGYALFVRRTILPTHKRGVPQVRRFVLICNATACHWLTPAPPKPAASENARTHKTDFILGQTDGKMWSTRHCNTCSIRDCKKGERTSAEFTNYSSWRCSRCPIDQSSKTERVEDDHLRRRAQCETTVVVAVWNEFSHWSSPSSSANESR